MSSVFQDLLQLAARRSRSGNRLLGRVFPIARPARSPRAGLFPAFTPRLSQCAVADRFYSVATPGRLLL